MSQDEFRPRKLFTNEEANRMLPLVRRIVADIVGVTEDWAAVYERFQRLETDAGEFAQDSDEAWNFQEQMESHKQRLIAFAKELEELGVLLKGPREGLVDFPSLRDGRVVFLCWKHGEPAIEHWHEIEAGFSGRQPLTPAMALKTPIS